MSFKANVQRDSQGNILIHMEGDLSYEHSAPFKEQLVSLLERNPTSRIHIDLAGLDFVGSSGICHFVETINILNTRYERKLNLRNAGIEFFRLFKLYGEEAEKKILEAFEMDEDSTEEMSQRFGARKRTFQN